VRYQRQDKTNTWLYQRIRRAGRRCVFVIGVDEEVGGVDAAVTDAVAAAGDEPVVGAFESEGCASCVVVDAGEACSLCSPCDVAKVDVSVGVAEMLCCLLFVAVFAAAVAVVDGGGEEAGAVVVGVEDIGAGAGSCRDEEEA